MKLFDSDNNGFRVFEAFIVSFLLILIFYPGFILLKTTPMLGNSWELMDPVVSFANFEPSFRVFQYELIHHKNLLWSNLRSMGLPLLANDIHAAPMFPLTLLFFWVPAEYFWNIFVVARLFLMGAGTYLLARNMLKFKSIPAMFFVLSFIYSLFVLQWMNHSWQNGLLAGIWYLYFLYLLPANSRPPYNLKRFLVVFGLTICVYSMVTCGFPEGSAMFAVLVVLVYSPFVASLLFSKKIRPSHFIFDLVFAHAVGFALSAAQIFSVFEMLSLYEAAEQRSTYGLRQFPLKDFFPFWAENITLFTGAAPTLFKDSRTYFGLIPLFLFLMGIVWSLRNILRTGYGQIGALFCGIFVVLKFFPFWDAFNRFVGSLPVLKESYFFVYFLSIFLWFFAYFIAQGVQALFYETEGHDTRRIRFSWSLLVLLSAGTVLALVWFSIPVVYKTTFGKLFSNEPEGVQLSVLLLFIASFLIVQVFLNVEKVNRQRRVVGILILAFAVLEMFVVLPRDFRPVAIGITKQSEQLADEITGKGISPNEVRIQDPNGVFVSGGVATIDNGAPAVLPVRLFVFRRTLFDVRGGYFPVQKAYFDYSWALTSTGFFPSGKYLGGVVSPSKEKMKRAERDQIVIDEIKVDGAAFSEKQREVSGQQSLFFRGWAVASSGGGVDTLPVFIVFRNNETEVSWPARKVLRPDVAHHFDDNTVVNAGWEARINADFLEPGDYEVIVRATRVKNGSYFEKKADRNVKVLEAGRKPGGSFAFESVRNNNLQYIGATNQRFIYYEPKALPRAYLASRCFPVDHYSRSVEHISDKTSFRLGDVFVEELSDTEEIICRNVLNSEPAPVAIESDLGKEIQLVNVKGPAVLMLNDTYYPGWKAFDQNSGEQLFIRPANIAMRSLILPEDRDYQITFKYVPDWLNMVRILLWGACLSLAVLFGFSLSRSRPER